MKSTQQPGLSPEIKWLRSLVREVRHFPKPGINFYDVTTLMGDGKALKYITQSLHTRYAPHSIDLIVGIEARGFVFGAPLAYELGIGFVPVRKPGKLPHTVERMSYTLEYGENTLEIHSDALPPGARVVVVDDLLATGGTAKATTNLISKLGGEVVEVACVIELTFLPGRANLAPTPVYSLLQYES